MTIVAHCMFMSEDTVDLDCIVLNGMKIVIVAFFTFLHLRYSYLDTY